MNWLHCCPEWLICLSWDMLAANDYHTAALQVLTEVVCVDDWCTFTEVMFSWLKPGRLFWSLFSLCTELSRAIKLCNSAVMWTTFANFLIIFQIYSWYMLHHPCLSKRGLFMLRLGLGGVTDWWNQTISLDDPDVKPWNKGHITGNQFLLVGSIQVLLDTRTSKGRAGWLKKMSSAETGG